MQFSWTIYQNDTERMFYESHQTFLDTIIDAENNVGAATRETVSSTVTSTSPQGYSICLWSQVFILKTDERVKIFTAASFKVLGIVSGSAHVRG